MSAAVAFAGLPATNRGVSHSGSDTVPAVRTAVCVDWFAASVDLVAVLKEQGEPNTWEIMQDVNGYGYTTGEVAAALVCLFFADAPGIVLDKEQRKGTFYKWRYHLLGRDGKKLGQLEFGGPHTMRQDGTPTARVELTGQGCRAYEGDAESAHAERWAFLRAKLASVGGRLSRVDTAFDDLDGVHNIAHALRLWQSGQLNNRGQQPNVQQVSDLKGRKGDTIYIGSRTSEKLMRVYEKGKELGDEVSPWVRWEIQFKASTRKELSLDMLTNPAEFMRGAYAALHFVSELARRLDVTKEQAAATVKSALRHLRRQYGATLNFLSHALPDSDAVGVFVSENLSGPKFPAWACQFLGAGVFGPLLDAMRSPRESGIAPATSF